MIKRKLSKYLPTREKLRENRYFRRYGVFLQHPDLWHLSRRSVSGGLAVGLFSGLVPGPLQMLVAVILAVPLRVNLPVALVATFYTNPITIGPLYLLAYAYGRLLIGGEAATIEAPPFQWMGILTWAEAYASWALSLGKPLLVGLIALAVTLAACGWLLVQLGWRIYIIRELRRRAARRKYPREPVQ